MNFLEISIFSAWRTGIPGLANPGSSQMIGLFAPIKIYGGLEHGPAQEMAATQRRQAETQRTWVSRFQIA